MSATKAGRKQKHFIDPATGLPVVGLTRRPDGRWRIIGTHKTFREPDERRAIEKFLRMTGTVRKSVFLPVAKSIDPADLASAADALDSRSDLALIEHEDGE